MLSFRVDRDVIQSGECTTLRWDAEGALSIHLDGQGVTGHEARQICPQVTTTYTLQVTTTSGDVYRSVTVTVSGPPQPPQISFIADAYSIWRGQCTVLHWDVENAQTVHLDGQGMPGHYASSLIVNSGVGNTLRLVLCRGERIIDIEVRAGRRILLNGCEAVPVSEASPLLCLSVSKVRLQ